MDTDRYIGPTKIKEISETNKKSPQGKDLFLVTFEGDSDRPQYITKDLFELISSKEQEDDAYVQQKKADSLLPKMVDLISEYNLKFFELSKIMELAHERFENRLERASNYLWTGHDEYWVPGYNFTNDISTLDIREVLTKIAENNNNEE